MHKKFFLPALLLLVSCASGNKPFSQGIINPSEIPRIFVHVVSEELSIDPLNYHIQQQQEIPVNAALGLQPGQSLGVVDQAIVQGVINALERDELNKIEQTFEEVTTSLSGYAFEDRFHSAFRKKIIETGMIKGREVEWTEFAYDYSEAAPGSVIIQARHAFSAYLSLLRVSITASRKLDAGAEKGWYISRYLYEFQLPETMEERSSRLSNLQSWSENIGVLEHLLTTGIETTIELMELDLNGVLTYEQAESITLKPDFSLAYYSEAKLLSLQADRAIVQVPSLGMIAAVPLTHLSDHEASNITLSEFIAANGVTDNKSGDTNVSPAVLGSRTEALPDITGTYSDNLNMIVRLEQQEKIVKGIIGSIGGDNVIEGLRRGNEIGFNFKYSPTTFGVKNGTGKLTIKPDGSGLTGHRSGGTFPARTPWELVRVKIDEDEAFIERGESDSAEAIDFSGKYTSRVSGVNLFYFTATESRPDVIVEQDGNQISGSFGKYLSGVFTGKVNGDRVLIEWNTKKGQGTARFVVTPGADKITGTWQGKDGNYGKWELSRQD